MNQSLGAHQRGAGCRRVFRFLFVVLGLLLVTSRASVAQTLPDGWTGADIGNPNLPGWVNPAECSSVSGSCRGLGITAAGADIWGSSDQFAFAYTQLHGDGSIVARVDALIPTDPWAKAGVMIRESLAAEAKHAFALVAASMGTAFQRRSETGWPSGHPVGRAGHAPAWVRLDRSSSTLAAYESADGISWTLIGSETLLLPATVYVGVAVTSHNAETWTWAGVSNVTVSTSPIPTEPLLPQDWSSQDIG